MDDRATRAIDVHRSLLERWRGAMDLVGPGPSEPHFVDAIAVVSELDVSGQWADLGSGAGFPGIALAAVHANAQITLAESRLKRATFLKRVVHTAKLENTTVHHGRTEELADGEWDGVISRAYKPPDLFLDDAGRLLKSGGMAVLMLGEEAEIPSHASFTLMERSTYAVPDGRRQRVVFIKI